MHHVTLYSLTLHLMWPHPGAPCVATSAPQLASLPATRGLGAEAVAPSVEEEEALRQVGLNNPMVALTNCARSLLCWC